MMISKDKFRTVVKNTPLVSIDFIIRDKENRYLLGKRNNKPAQGYWFTLGGRIFKDESIQEAIKRLSLQEFNLQLSQDALKFQGIYEHFYPDSYSDDAISTHYVVLAFQVEIDQMLELPLEQHHDYGYFTQEELMVRQDVHSYVKNYFKGNL